MIVGLGIDVVDVKRIRSLRESGGQRFLDRVYTRAEVESCTARADPDPHLAARFAAKEAAMKALGTGWGEGVGWRDVEVVSDMGRPPRLALSGEAEQRARNAGVCQVHVTLTHDGGVAAAVVILEA